MKNKLHLYIVITLALLSLVACESSGEKVESTKKEAAANIKGAEVNLDMTRDQADRDIENAKGAEAVDEAKIKATKDIAAAKHQIGNEKVTATEKIVDAEQKAEVEAEPELP